MLRARSGDFAIWRNSVFHFLYEPVSVQFGNFIKTPACKI